MTVTPETFDFYVFHRTVRLDRICHEAGVNGLIVDLESHGKRARQVGYDTEINAHGVQDVREIKQALGCYVLCRVNQHGPDLAGEIDRAIDHGADEIIVPMIRTLQEAEAVVGQVNGRCEIMLMIETVEAAGIVQQLSALPIRQCYVGLNDLMISRGSPCIFQPLADGLLDTVRAGCGGLRFGFGGLTLVGCGWPLPVEYLINEMARLGCAFSFLRRSFFRDSVGRCLETEIAKIREQILAAKLRKEACVQADKAALRAILSEMTGN